MLNLETYNHQSISLLTSRTRGKILFKIHKESRTIKKLVLILYCQTELTIEMHVVSYFEYLFYVICMF